VGAFEIGLFVTRGLYDRCTAELDDCWKARDIAATFIEGAFARSESHTVTVECAPEPVDAPTDRIRTSCEAPHPRHGTVRRWPTLRRWWGACLDCPAPDRPVGFSKDCNLLLTAAPGGGLGGPREACAGGSFRIAEAFDEYHEWGTGPAFNAVDTLLEEVGHSLIDGMADRDYGDDGDGVVAHDSGTLYEHDGVFAITPLGISGDTRYNNCGERVDKHRWNGDAWEARYSECTERYFRER
jgi:hypothetical protein